MSTASNSYFSLSLAPRPGGDLAAGRPGEQHSGRRQGCPRAGFPGCPGDAAAQAGPGAHGARCRAVTGAPTSGSPARPRRAAWVPDPPAAPPPERSAFPGGARAAARPRPFPPGPAPPGPAPRSRVGGKAGRARRRRRSRSRAPGRGGVSPGGDVAREAEATATSAAPRGGDGCACSRSRRHGGCRRPISGGAGARTEEAPSVLPARPRRPEMN